MRAQDLLASIKETIASSIQRGFGITYQARYVCSEVGLLRRLILISVVVALAVAVIFIPVRAQIPASAGDFSLPVLCPGPATYLFGRPDYRLPESLADSPDINHYLRTTCNSRTQNRAVTAGILLGLIILAILLIPNVKKLSTDWARVVWVAFMLVVYVVIALGLALALEALTFSRAPIMVALGAIGVGTFIGILMMGRLIETPDSRQRRFDDKDFRSAIAGSFVVTYFAVSAVFLLFEFDTTDTTSDVLEDFQGLMKLVVGSYFAATAAVEVLAHNRSGRRDATPTEPEPTQPAG